MNNPHCILLHIFSQTFSHRDASHKYFHRNSDILIDILTIEIILMIFSQKFFSHTFSAILMRDPSPRHSLIFSSQTVVKRYQTFSQRCSDSVVVDSDGNDT